LELRNEVQRLWLENDILKQADHGTKVNVIRKNALVLGISNVQRSKNCREALTTISLSVP
jgi:hypothetical protein